jgi:signal transduction histidine kinase
MRIRGALVFKSGAVGPASTGEAALELVGPHPRKRLHGGASFMLSGQRKLTSSAAAVIATIREARSVKVQHLVVMALVATAYVSAAEAGFALASATKQVAAVWPPTGIALSAFVLCGWRIWPGVFLGAFISSAMRHEPIATAFGIAVGNTLGPLFGAWLLRRFVGFDPSLGRLRDVLGLALLGSATMALTATSGVLNLALAGVVRWDDISSWWVWWVGDAMGALILGAVILTSFASQKGLWESSHLAELVAVGVVLLVLSVGCFSSSLPLAYLVFPAVIWVALRFGQRESSVSVLLVSAVAVWQTVHDQGPFALGSLDRRMIMLVTFVTVLAATAQALNALVTERRRAETALREAKDELESRVALRTTELATAKAELIATNSRMERRMEELARKNEEVEAFVYIVSHDLRAPLVNLQGFSRELELSCRELIAMIDKLAPSSEMASSLKRIATDGVAGALHYIGAAVTKFERLINALLTLSRTGQQQYHIEVVDIRELVNATVTSLHQTVEAVGATITVGDLPSVKGDATAIGQIFSNLLVNSLKYISPSRSVMIEIAGARENSLVHYYVRDNGVGIPDRAKPRIFQIFQRFHPDIASGDGLGLAAVKRIVERHGGEIWVDSTVDVGSTFHFTLPAADKG